MLFRVCLFLRETNLHGRFFSLTRLDGFLWCARGGGNCPCDEETGRRSLTTTKGKRRYLLCSHSSISHLYPRSGLAVNSNGVVAGIVASGTTARARKPRPRRPRWRRRGRQRRRRLCYWGTVSETEWLDCWNVFESSSSLCSRAMCRLTVLFLVNVRVQNGHGTLIPWWRCRTWARKFVS